MRLQIAVCALAVVALGACSDDGEKATTSTTPTPSEALTSIRATASDFKFEPSSWTVPKGEEFSIVFKNSGVVAHEWAVIKLGEDLASEKEFTEDKVLFEVEAVDAGKSATQKFTVEEAGAYQVICALETHFDAGMEGTLTVK